MPPFANMRNLLVALVIGGVGLSGLPVEAQQTNVGVQGTVESLDSKVLHLRGPKGGEVSVALDSKTAVFIRQPSSLDAIKVGDYVASAAVKGADGKLRSKELRIFPEALRGIGEGQRPMKAPDTLMTNASVSKVMAVPEGRVIKVEYNNGTAELIVGPEVPIIALVAADMGALKAGTKVFILGTKSQDGTIQATRIVATD
ncbi:DUF5666 domain-containing protein [Taklimakanibacter deserti]|uniref:DUF5666 domain-containing protein n=1 Tax=Taklimakanibacter deserti TaxID=2267839 RepID=UPI000E647D72